MTNLFSMHDKPHEECGVFGISTRSGNAVTHTYRALLAMQHRGQEASGIAVQQENKIQVHKGLGLVTEVMTSEGLSSLPSSNIAIGHNRYSAKGSSDLNDVQPVVADYFTGRIAVAHNGNIINSPALRDDLRLRNVTFHGAGDTEVVASSIAYNILMNHDLIDGIISATRAFEGAFTLVILCGNGKLVAVRDPSGYRPLCIGKNEDSIAIASESCGIESCGMEFVRDIAPGEIVIVENGEITTSKIALKKTSPRGGFCIFEYIYFSRPDSVLDGLYVYEARRNMGRILAEECPVDADIVCAIPDSGLEASIGFSEASGIPIDTGFFKNRYVGRSFIYPTQQARENAVRLKLSPIKPVVEGKRVVLVDDSIVRGTTCSKIISSMRQSGAKEVHLRISSPPFRFPCNYGTDVSKDDKLIAKSKTVSQICEKIGADSLDYISIDGLRKACEKCRLPFCTDCFTGNNI